MRHGVDGRKFGRNTSHRVAMLRNLANSVILEEQVVTTVEKAKEARRIVDRLVTLGKQGVLHSRRLAFDRTRSDLVVEKLFSGLAIRFAERKGGYTRVLKMSDRRRGDGAELAVLELVDHPEIIRGKAQKAVGKSGNGADTADVDAAVPADPFKRLRKLFQPKKV